MSSMRWGRALVGGVALLLATLGVLHAVTSGPPSSSERAAALDKSLRCPTCNGESIAQSEAPIARSMRATVADQVAHGRSDDEIRSWFRQRYGATVLLQPPNHGFGVLAWVLPVVALVVALLAAYAGLRRRPRDALPPPQSSADAAVEVSPAPPVSAARRRGAMLPVVAGAVAVVAAAVLVAHDAGDGTRPAAASPMAAGSPSAEPSPTAATSDPHRAEQARRLVTEGHRAEKAGRLGTAASAYRRALDLDPGNDTARFRLAFALVRDGRPTQAVPLLETLLSRQPTQPDALLLLGVVQRNLGDPRATATLGRFLQVAPHHPAAAQVRALLRRPGGTR